MAKKPLSAYKKKADTPRKRTARDWMIIAFTIFLAITLVVPLVASFFTAGAGHGGF